MCGFVGIINNKDQAVDYAVLSQMADTLNHRGPDDEGHLLEEVAEPGRLVAQPRLGVRALLGHPVALGDPRPPAS